MNNIKTTFTVEEVRQILKIGKNTAYSLVKEDGFPTIRIGKQIRIPCDDFNEWVNKMLLKNESKDKSA